MQNSIKKFSQFLKKIGQWLIVLGILAFVCRINIVRLRNNVYANYEKVVDYGRVRENKVTVAPAIAVIFYNDKDNTVKNITTYFNHFDNYKKRNVKIVLIPRILNAENKLVLAKLYTELFKHNNIEKITFVDDKSKDFSKHLELIKDNIPVQNIESLVFENEDIAAKNQIEEILNLKNQVVIMPLDLTEDSADFKKDFLLNVAMYFAQKNAYHMQVFDMIDTQMAQLIENDYSVLYALTNKEDVPLLVQQKRNLEQYKKRYANELLHYLKINMAMAKDFVWPAKNDETYRLFDRGSVYVRLYDEELCEIFARKRVQKNKGVIVSLIEIANKAARKIDTTKVKYIKISILTDLEEINKSETESLAKYLDVDDGVYIQYEDKNAIMVADERPDDSSSIVEDLRKRASISEDVSESKIKFYKFKATEISDEN